MNKCILNFIFILTHLNFVNIALFTLFVRCELRAYYNKSLNYMTNSGKKDFRPVRKVF